MTEADPRDRVLEHALSRTFRPAAEVDLTERIRAAWEAGERGVDLADLDVDAPTPRARPRTTPVQAGSPRGPARWLVAASIAVVLGGAIVWKLSSRVGVERTRLAVPTRAVRVLRDGVELATHELRAGDLVWTEPGSEGALRFDSGLELSTGPATLVRLDVDGLKPAIDLVYGTLSIDAVGAGGARLASALAIVELEPGARLRARSVFERSGGALAPADPALVLGESSARAADEPAFCELELERGGARTARVVFSSSAENGETAAPVAPGARGEGQARSLSSALAPEALVPGRVRTLVARPGTTAAVDLADLGPLRGALALFAEKPPEPWPLAQREIDYVEGLRAEETARAMLAAEPSAWLVLEPKLRALFAMPTWDRGFRFHLLNVAALDASPSAVRIARDLWLEHPGAFTEDHVVAFAELGVPEFERETEALVASCGARGVPPPIFASVDRLGRGDPRARACLAELVRDPVLLEKKEDVALLAAAALDRAGEPQPWRDAIGALARRVETLLAQDELFMASRVALTGEHFDRERRSPEPLRASFCLRRTDAHLDERSQAVQTREEIRAVVAALEWSD